jgi:hypothetical protein
MGISGLRTHINAVPVAPARHFVPAAPASPPSWGRFREVTRYDDALAEIDAFGPVLR